MNESDTCGSVLREKNEPVATCPPEVPEKEFSRRLGEANKAALAYHSGWD